MRRQAMKIWSDCPPGERAREYLRRASEAERQAVGASEALRQELIDLAVQWRDLARQAERLANGEPEEAQ